MRDHIQAPDNFPDRGGKAALEAFRAGLDATIDGLGNAQSSSASHALKCLKVLRAEANAKNFNISRLNNVQLGCVFAGIITMLLLSSSNIKADVVWMPDAGEVADFSLALAGTLWQSHVFWLCQKNGVSASDVLSLADTTGGPGKKSGWFDELIRVPDYLARPLSKLDIKNKKIAQPAELDRRHLIE